MSQAQGSDGPSGSSLDPVADAPAGPATDDPPWGAEPPRGDEAPVGGAPPPPLEPPPHGESGELESAPSAPSAAFAAFDDAGVPPSPPGDDPGVPPPPPGEPPRKADVAALLRALAGLAAVGVSLGGAGVQIALGARLDTFITKNELGPRKALELWMLLGGCALGLAALVYVVVGLFRRDTPRRIDALHQLATFTLPLTLVFLLPPLFRWSAWQALPLELVLLATTVGLALEPMLRLSQRSAPDAVVRAASWVHARVPRRLARWGPPVIVGVAAVGYAAFASYFTVMHHQRLGTACYDLGQYDNLFHNALNGHPFRVTSISGEEDWKSLRGHAEIGMYALLPFYALRPGPEALLVLQGVLLGSAAIPVYLFGVRFVSRWAAMIVTLAYVFYAPLHRANFYDFHMQPVAAVFILWMLYFLVARRDVLFWLAYLLAVTMREDISVGLAVLGLFLVVTGYRLRTGIALSLLSVAYFVTLKWYVMPMFGEWWFADIYKQLQIPGRKGYGPIVQTLTTNPAYVFTTLVTKEKLGYAIQMLMPLAFLPVRRAYLALAIVPGFIFTLLTTGYTPTVSIQFQYNAHWIPYIFPAALVALRVLGGDGGTPVDPRSPPAGGESAAGGLSSLAGQAGAWAEGAIRRRAALATLVLLSLVSTYHYGALLQRRSFKSGFSKIEFSMSAIEKQRYADVREIVAQIPPGASVAATEHLAPHVSTRSSLYCFRSSIGLAEYVVFGAVDRTARTTKPLKDLLAKGTLGVIAEKGTITLLRRGADTSRNAEFAKKL